MALKKATSQQASFLVPNNGPGLDLTAEQAHMITDLHVSFKSEQSPPEDYGQRGALKGRKVDIQMGVNLICPHLKRFYIFQIVIGQMLHLPFVTLLL